MRAGARRAIVAVGATPTKPAADLLPLHGLCRPVGAAAIASTVGSALQSFDDQPHGLDPCSLDNDAGWSLTYEPNSPIRPEPGPTAMSLTTTLAAAAQVGWSPPADWVAVEGP